MVLLLSFSPAEAQKQDQPVFPSFTATGNYLGITPAVRELPVISAAQWAEMEEKGLQKALNPKIRTRSFPYAERALPDGPDPVWQRVPAVNFPARAPLSNFEGQSSPYYPPDANGTVGPSHYVQTVNNLFTIYSKTGALLAGPTPINSLFAGLPGGAYNDGDPVVLYDEQAGRYLISEFSISGANDYILVAVSTTADPTGTWHAYSFDVADMPDYPKFGIWRDGYYLGTNNSSGNDIYVMERSQMLIGGAAQIVGFNNPWRPTTLDGFMCVPPVDNDGTFAPPGSPGLFITINDDAISGGSDQLWIYELDVDWNNPSSSTFSRTQQIAVAPFDSNFGTTWENIAQAGTTRKLDAVPQIVMNPPQYRNFGAHQTIVCCHTVDVNSSNQAGIRWYELRLIGGEWTIRQQSTYAPDGHSRWMGSIMINGNNEIALAYSISSSSLFPGIRYTGQSSISYLSATSTLDIAEEVIVTGQYSQTVSNRWGDYASLQVDPDNDQTFWFTGEYMGPAGTRLTRISHIEIPDPPGKWTGNISPDWNNPGNWAGGEVPGPGTTVYIQSPAPFYPMVPGNLDVGTHCKVLYLFELSNLSVFGDVTIAPGKTVMVADSGLIIAGGNWNNNGFFEEGQGLVMFTGAGQKSITRGESGNVVNYFLDEQEQIFSHLSDALPGPEGDNGFQDADIGFTFKYCGADYESCRISTNGWVSMNRSGSTSNANSGLFSNILPNATLAPWFDDLKDDNTSFVVYSSEGVAPYRVFTVEWNRMLTFRNNSDARITFQLKLFETSNNIEFHYGEMEAGSHSLNESASIGIEDSVGGPGHFIEATTGSTTTAVTNLLSSNNWPLVNYRFIPADNKIEFFHLILNNPGGTLLIGSDADIHGDLSILPGSHFTIGNNSVIRINAQ